MDSIKEVKRYIVHDGTEFNDDIIASRYQSYLGLEPNLEKIQTCVRRLKEKTGFPHSAHIDISFTYSTGYIRADKLQAALKLMGKHMKWSSKEQLRTVIATIMTYTH